MRSAPASGVRWPTGRNRVRARRGPARSRSRAAAASVSISDDLPMPASPRRITARPRPVAATRSSSVASIASSARRPVKNRVGDRASGVAAATIRCARPVTPRRNAATAYRPATCEMTSRAAATSPASAVRASSRACTTGRPASGNGVISETGSTWPCEMPTASRRRSDVRSLPSVASSSAARTACSISLPATAPSPNTARISPSVGRSTRPPCRWTTAEIRACAAAISRRADSGSSAARARLSPIRATRITASRSVVSAPAPCAGGWWLTRSRGIGSAARPKGAALRRRSRSTATQQLTVERLGSRLRSDVEIAAQRVAAAAVHA